MSKSTQKWNFDLNLNQNSVQTDLSVYGEIVLDFSDMVESIYDSDANIRKE